MADKFGLNCQYLEHHSDYLIANGWPFSTQSALQRALRAPPRATGDTLEIPPLIKQLTHKTDWPGRRPLTKQRRHVESAYVFYLCKAVSDGDMEMLAFLLAGGREFVDVNSGRGRVLTAAVEKGDLSILCWLLDRNARIDETLVVEDAIRHSRYEMLELLVERGSVNSLRNAILFAAYEDRSQALELFVKRLGRTQVKDVLATKPPRWLRFNNHERVDITSQEYVTRMENDQNLERMEAAIQNGDVELVERLLGHLLKVCSHQRMFQLAVDTGDTRIAAIFVDDKVNLDARNGAALASAVSNRDREMTAFLIKRGARIQETRVVEDAVGQSSFATLEFLIELGCSMKKGVYVAGVNWNMDDGKTLKFFIERLGYAAVIKALKAPPQWVLDSPDDKRSAGEMQALAGSLAIKAGFERQQKVAGGHPLAVPRVHTPVLSGRAVAI